MSSLNNILGFSKTAFSGVSEKEDAHDPCGYWHKYREPECGSVGMFNKKFSNRVVRLGGFPYAAIATHAGCVGIAQVSFLRKYDSWVFTNEDMDNVPIISQEYVIKSGRTYCVGFEDIYNFYGAWYIIPRAIMGDRFTHTVTLTYKKHDDDLRGLQVILLVGCVEGQQISVPIFTALHDQPVAPKKWLDTWGEEGNKLVACSPEGFIIVGAMVTGTASYMIYKRSFDKGITWGVEEIFDLEAEYHYGNMLFHEGVIYVIASTVVHSPPSKTTMKVFKSEDLGDTWTLMTTLERAGTDKHPTDMTVKDGKLYIIFEFQGTGGFTGFRPLWSVNLSTYALDDTMQVPSPDRNSGSFYSGMQSAVTATRDGLIVHNGDALLKSFDGGISWTEIISTRAYTVNPQDPGIGYVSLSSDDNVVVCNWHFVHEKDADVYRVGFLDEFKAQTWDEAFGWTYAGVQGFILSKDAGSTWEFVRDPTYRVVENATVKVTEATNIIADKKRPDGIDPKWPFE